MEALPQAATRSDDAIDEEKAEGATLLPTSTLRSDDDRAEEKSAAKSAVAAVMAAISRASSITRLAILRGPVKAELWPKTTTSFAGTSTPPEMLATRE